MSYRYDRDSMSGGVLLYIEMTFQLNFWNMILELILKIVEINLRKRKCFFSGCYNPHKNKISNLVSSKYGKVYKNHANMTCVDLILTKDPYFQQSNVFENGS